MEKLKIERKKNPIFLRIYKSFDETEGKKEGEFDIYNIQSEKFPSLIFCGIFKQNRYLK